ncbi:MAG: 16S rRNA (uracil(1498)-N(3))-methyltransferase [Magnetococcus sp. WYHC-3]
MNRILFERQELQADGTVAFDDARARHIRHVLHADIGQVLQVGMLDGLAGVGRVRESGPERVWLDVTLDVETPPPWVDLLLAMPRPKVLKRLWAQLAALGVGRVVLINAARVERDYFATHWIEETHYRPLLVEGLVQAGNTHLPRIAIERRFRPYVEDRLDVEFPDSMRLVAHPGEASGVVPPRQPLAQSSGAQTPEAPRMLLAVGPEGGWTAFELELLEQRRFKRVTLGSRTLRTDTACVALLGALAACRV